jgi:chromosomal replication initiation ATPase DnaA
MAQQLTLDLGHRVALGREDFLVAPSNQTAVALVDQWPRWPSHGAIIEGPAGSGKSHLAQVWQHLASASRIAAVDVEVAGLPELFSGDGLVIEDLGEGAPNETALFHALNLAQQSSRHVLFTTAGPVSRAGLKLPDLLSRLSALPVAQILAPDDALLRGVLLKQFSDRQISVDEALLSYLVTRMPRSLGMVRELVSAIDAAALMEKAEVTRAFAGRVLNRLITAEQP